MKPAFWRMDLRGAVVNTAANENQVWEPANFRMRRDSGSIRCMMG